MEGGAPRPVAPAFHDARYATWTDDGGILFRGRRTAQLSEADELWITRPDSDSVTATGLFQRIRAANVRPYLGPAQISGGFLTFAGGSAEIANIYQMPIWLGHRPRGVPKARANGGVIGMQPSTAPDGSIVYESLQSLTHLHEISLRPEHDRRIIDLTSALSSDLPKDNRQKRRDQGGSARHCPDASCQWTEYCLPAIREGA